MQDHPRDLVGRVRGGAESVAAASSQIALGNGDLAGRTERQASELQSAASSMTELGETVRRNADNARQAAALAASASEVARRGGQVVEQMVTTMRAIDDSATRIADIIGVIDGIAFQTNILALNAAVEAGEVRSLARRSADAAREIKSLIQASVERVGQGNELAGQAGGTMQEVVAAIGHVDQIIREISQASDEQNAGVDQVGQAVVRMDGHTQQNAALVEQTSAASESLSRQAHALVETVSTFKT